MGPTSELGLEQATAGTGRGPSVEAWSSEVSRDTYFGSTNGSFIRSKIQNCKKIAAKSIIEPSLIRASKITKSEPKIEMKPFKYASVMHAKPGKYVL